MFPSWMRSRNCRPRFVYFFAIEITSRRFASVISRLARRAFASPVDICLLISFKSFKGMPIRFRDIVLEEPQLRDDKVVQVFVKSVADEHHTVFLLTEGYVVRRLYARAL